MNYQYEFNRLFVMSKQALQSIDIKNNKIKSLAALTALENAIKYYENEPANSISRVFEICNAYESGVGHGVKRDGLTGEWLFTDVELTEAYKLGYEEGSQQEIEDGLGHRPFFI